jgi:hypothetical protein
VLILGTATTAGTKGEDALREMPNGTNGIGGDHERIIMIVTAERMPEIWTGIREIAGTMK